MFLINGRFSESLSAQDRGLHYGDGLFETIAMQDGNPLCWSDHCRRLQEGCRRLALTCPDPDLLRSEITMLPVTTAKCVLKIIVTAGEGGRGYRRLSESQSAATRILRLYPWPDYPEDYAVQGVKTRICSTRLGLNPLLAGIKHLNRLEQVLARSEWGNQDIMEGLMSNTEGAVIAGTMSNLFTVKGKVLSTPDLSACGVAGIIRRQILALSRQLDLQGKVGTLTIPDLYEAGEVFLCNSVIGVWPVRAIDNREISMGPVSQQVRRLLIRESIIAA